MKPNILLSQLKLTIQKPNQTTWHLRKSQHIYQISPLEIYWQYIDRHQVYNSSLVEYIKSK